MNGSHELVVNVTSKNTHFFLDRLQYVPSNDTMFENALVMIPNTDHSISYSPGWSSSDDFVANMTKTTSAYVNISFTGESIGWFGAISSGFQDAGPLAQYSIDDGRMFNLTFQGSNFSSDIPNVPFFEINASKQEKHRLFVRYQGNESAIPLTLSNIVVANKPEPSTSTTSSVGPTNKPSSSSISYPASTVLNSSSTTRFSDKQGSTAGAIAGGVIGALVGLIVMVLLFIYCRRLKRRKLQVVTPFQMEYQDSPASHSPMPLTRERESPNDNSTSPTTRYDTAAPDVFTQSKYVPLHREGSQSSSSSTATTSSFVTSTASSSTSSTM